MNILDIAKRIEAAGGTLYLVGGGVRDEWMGRPSKDMDFCVTGMTQHGFSALFPDAFLAGKQFPVFRLNVDNERMEFALARTERKIGVGHRGFEPHSSSKVTIEEDLHRRDLTFNAMAKHVLAGNIVDPYGGREDIRAGTVRAVSDAFAEDPLRVYRAARFSANFEFRIHPHTLELMHSLRDELVSLSVERVFEELKKALSVRRPSLFFRGLLAAHVLDVHFPEVERLIGVEQPVKWHPEGDAFEHTMQVLDAAARQTDRVEIRFAALVHDVGKGLTPRDKWPSHSGHEAAGVPIVDAICQRLKLPIQWWEAARFATEHHMKVHFLHKMKPTKVVDLLTEANRNPISVCGFAIVGLADIQGRGNPIARDENAERIEELWEYVQQVNGKTIETETEGKAFGEALRRARARKVEEWRRQHPVQA